MKEAHRRLDRLHERLTARERARLVLIALKEDKDEGFSVRVMPASQIEEFDRLIGLMNGVNIRLGAFVALLHERVLVLSQRLGWLATLVLFEGAVDSVELFLRMNVKRPLTEGEYEEARRRAEEELIPVGALAEEEAERDESWQSEDLVQDERFGEVVSEAAWQRVKKEKARRLRALVSEGVLDGRRTRRGLCVRAASYYGWRGEDVPVFIDDHVHVEVVPDSRSEEVELWRRSWEHLQRSLCPFAAAAVRRKDGDGETAGGLRQILEGKIRGELDFLSVQLDAVDRIVGEVAEEFGGEDPCHPSLRELLDDAKASFERDVDFANDLKERIDLPGADEDDLDLLRERISRPVIS